jgi:hypothetical protein
MHRCDQELEAGQQGGRRRKAGDLGGPAGKRGLPPQIELHDDRTDVPGADVGFSVRDANQVMSVNGLNDVAMSHVIGASLNTNFELVLLIKSWETSYSKILTGSGAVEFGCG